MVLYITIRTQTCRWSLLNTLPEEQKGVQPEGDSKLSDVTAPARDRAAAPRGHLRRVLPSGALPGGRAGAAQIDPAAASVSPPLVTLLSYAVWHKMF